MILGGGQKIAVARPIHMSNTTTTTTTTTTTK